MTYGVRICNFTETEGEGVDINGRTWRWEFGRQFGPIFLDKDGDPLRVQPTDKSPAWPVFERWYTDFKTKRDGPQHGAPPNA